ncbi:MAG: hypothetical protein ABR987_08070 [Terracidiphilus sp.]|jgi:hypothetical protein
MKELLSDETLTAADLVNPARSAAGVAELDLAEEAKSYPSDRIPSDSVLEERNLEPVAAVNQPAQPNALFPNDELQSFRSHWNEVQTSFVDDPRTAVKQADGLVANVVKRIAEQFASEREQLEKQWDRGEDVNTEDLRQALKRYRAFFDRLLSF